MSPLVALYFATESDFDIDGVVWALNPIDLNACLDGKRVFKTAQDSRVSALIRPVFRKDQQSPNEVAALLGDEVDLRMMMQQAVFTIHGTSAPLDENDMYAPFLKKISVKASDKRPLRNSLFVLGITRSTLFPDLENLATHLERTRFSAEEAV